METFSRSIPALISVDINNYYDRLLDEIKRKKENFIESIYIDYIVPNKNILIIIVIVCLFLLWRYSKYNKITKRKHKKRVRINDEKIIIPIKNVSMDKISSTEYENSDYNTQYDGDLANYYDDAKIY